MLDQIKCECGHANPPGTEICESCGMPFDEEANHSPQLINMRYEGAARRSQTYKKTIIDQIWNFFSSVKVAIWMIVITLIASIFGTIFPQQLYIPSNADPAVYYPEQYGFLGQLYYIFGLYDMYSSWWYVSLLVMIGISLVVCSIDRVIPLYRALKRQRVTKHRSFMQRQRISGQTTDDEPEKVLKRSKQALKEKGYHVREEEKAVMGEKGRFSRWGPYINHIGLIIFLIGVLMRILPGFTIDEYIWVRDGQTVPVNGTDHHYVKSEGFFLETYDDGEFPRLDQVIEENPTVPREFRTEAVLYERKRNPTTDEDEMIEVKRHSILVNDPLVYKGLKLFQSDYRINEYSEFSFAIAEKGSDKVVGEIQIDLYEPQATYPLRDGVEVTLLEYYPDFELKNGQPSTKSPVPNNPSFIFKVTSPQHPEGERIWIFLGNTIEDPEVENEYAIKLSNVKLSSVSGLMVRKDVSLPIISVGGVIVMIGLVMGFYWQHRRIWMQREEGNEILIAAHTNKNWYGITKDVGYVLEQTELKLDAEALDKEAKRDE